MHFYARFSSKIHHIFIWKNAKYVWEFHVPLLHFRAVKSKRNLNTFMRTLMFPETRLNLLSRICGIISKIPKKQRILSTPHLSHLVTECVWSFHFSHKSDNIICQSALTKKEWNIKNTINTINNDISCNVI